LNLIQAWLALEEAVQAAPVSGFGKQLSSILEKYFSELVPFCLCLLLFKSLNMPNLPGKYFFEVADPLFS
jgi:hypothetical protein